MPFSRPHFRDTWLWRQAFQTPRSDSTTEEQEFFRTQYLSIRERAAQLVSRIAIDLPGMTVHDISHLDALWDTASSVAEGAINVNPAEAFVLGASILLHDAAMSLAAYPGGLAEVRTTVAWKDAIARLALASEESGGEKFDVEIRRMRSCNASYQMFFADCMPSALRNSPNKRGAPRTDRRFTSLRTRNCAGSTGRRLVRSPTAIGGLCKSSNRNSRRTWALLQVGP